MASGMGIGMWLFWLLIVLLLVVLLRAITGSPPDGSQEKPLERLQKRYADGETSQQEYERIKRDLQDKPS